MLTVKQLAERLSLSQSKVYELIAARKIEHHKIDGAIRITEEQLAAYLDSTRQPLRVPLQYVPRRHMKSKHLRNL